MAKKCASSKARRTKAYNPNKKKPLKAIFSGKKKSSATGNPSKNAKKAARR